METPQIQFLIHPMPLKAIKYYYQQQIILQQTSFMVKKVNLFLANLLGFLVLPLTKQWE